jgi:hypothetical protein
MTIAPHTSGNPPTPLRAGLLTSIDGVCNWPVRLITNPMLDAAPYRRR